MRWVLGVAVAVSLSARVAAAQAGGAPPPPPPPPPGTSADAVAPPRWSFDVAPFLGLALGDIVDEVDSGDGAGVRLAVYHHGVGDGSVYAAARIYFGSADDPTTALDQQDVGVGYRHAFGPRPYQGFTGFVEAELLYYWLYYEQVGWENEVSGIGVGGRVGAVRTWTSRIDLTASAGFMQGFGGDEDTDVPTWLTLEVGGSFRF